MLKTDCYGCCLCAKCKNFMNCAGMLCYFCNEKRDYSVQECNEFKEDKVDADRD